MPKEEALSKLPEKIGKHENHGLIFMSFAAAESWMLLRKDLFVFSRSKNLGHVKKSAPVHFFHGKTEKNISGSGTFFLHHVPEE